MTDKALIIIPTYNEIANLGNIAPRVLQQGATRPRTDNFTNRTAKINVNELATIFNLFNRF